MLQCAVRIRSGAAQQTIAAQASTARYEATPRAQRAAGGAAYNRPRTPVGLKHQTSRKERVMTNFLDEVKGAATEAVHKVSDVAKSVAGKVADVAGKVEHAAEQAWDATKQAAKSATGAADQAVEKSSQPASGAADEAKDVGKAAGNAASEAVEAARSKPS
jgi:uncharacterized protein YjbJ (UPF0337 family)